MKYIRLLLLLLVGCSAKNVVTENSLPEVLIGMSTDRVLRAFPSYTADDNLTTALGDCYYLRDTSANNGVNMMIVDDIVARIDITENSTITTDKGVGINSSKSEVINAYPQLIEQTHPYLGQAGQYLIVNLPSGYGIVFETAFDIVTDYRLGRYPEVSYIEGCN